MSIRNWLDFRPYRYLTVLILISFGLRLVLIFQPIEVLLHKFLADDTYYYYVLAQNIAQGQGVVFNHGVPTNGFHPLYALLLVPIFELLNSFGTNVPVYASLVLLSVVTVLTAIPIYMIGDELHSEPVGLLAAFLWLFNPFVLFVSLSGLESPLQAFFIALLIWYILTQVDRSAPTYGQAAIVGGLVALAFLSRMDSVLIGAGFFIALTIRAVWNGESLVDRGELASRIAPVVSGGVVASLLVSPWVLWNVLVVGRLTPVSGAALRAMRLEGSTPYWQMVGLSMFDTARFVWNYFFYGLFSSLSGILRVSIAFFLLVGIILVLIRRDRFTPLIKQLDFLIIGGLFYYPFYWFYELGMRPWYSLFTLLVLSLLLALSLAEFLKLSNIEKIPLGRIAMVILIFSGLFIASGAAHYQEGTYPQEVTKWEAAHYIQDEISDNATIGSFNTGIYQYYTPNHDVINLDGVMNPETYRAQQQGRLSEYICTRGIDYIIDPPGAVRELRSELDLKPLHQFPTGNPNLNRGNSTYILYEIRGCG